MAIQAHNTFDQLTAASDHTRQVGFAAMMARRSQQSVGLGWSTYRRAENGERTKSAALSHSSIDLVMKWGAHWLVFECKALPGCFQTSTRRVDRGPFVTDAQERTRLETTYRVVRSLMEREQIALARKTLNALPVGCLDDPIIVRLRQMLAVPTTKTTQKRDIDRKQDYQWIRDHAEEYRGQWIALNNGQLLANAASLRELMDCVKALRLECPPLVHQINQ
ncbi:MAG: hypothetical protein ACREQW_08350 [Candidatus Binatia bacterium]